MKGTDVARGTSHVIVAMGDSTTAGTPGWESPIEAPPAGRGDETSQYAYWLMKSHPGWLILNRGVNGERSDQIRARFDRDAIAESPAAVVLIAGVNDVYQGREADRVTAELRLMYDQTMEAGIPIVAGTIIPYNTATDGQNARMAEINAWIRSQARPGRIAVAETRAAAALPADVNRLFESPDGLHPSPAGYRRMADAIGPVLETLLPRPR
jgi:lysophospholipase L1-like esterase